MIQIFDGAMGTMLQNAGMKTGDCPEYLNITNPKMVQDVHRAYFEAGSDIIETNTFGASRIKLAEYNLADKVAEINTAAVQNVKNSDRWQSKSSWFHGTYRRIYKTFGRVGF